MHMTLSVMPVVAGGSLFIKMVSHDFANYPECRT